MNCDLILNESSCRFCLGDTQDGVSIQSTKKSYFYVDKRLVLTSDILSFLNLKIQDLVLPNMPSKICQECKTSLCSFYSLKKNFLENEAVLIGKVAEPSGSTIKVSDKDSVRAKLLEIVDEFLEEHVDKDLQVTKHKGKLVISQQSEQSGEKLKVIVSDDPVKDPLPQASKRDPDDVESVCSSCGEIFRSTDEHPHKCFDEVKMQPSDSPSPIFPGQIEDLLTSPQELTNEEYLDEEESRAAISEVSAEEYEVMEYEEVKDEYEPFVDVKSGDNKPFLCFYCGKPFASRSGRDTHQQLKHKAEGCNPTDIEAHEMEIELESGELVRKWKCPHCNLTSSKKSHHQTHLIRHAIRDRQEPFPWPNITNSLMLQNFPRIGESANSQKVPEVDEMTPTIVASPINASVTTIELANGKNLFECSSCEARFQGKIEASAHVQKFGKAGACHSNTCRDCNVVFLTDKLFKRHQHHHDLSPITSRLQFHECLQCKVVFGSQNHLDAHTSQHVLNQAYKYKPVKSSRLEGCEVIEDFENECSSGDFHCAYCTKWGSRDEMYFHMAIFHASLKCPFDKAGYGRNLGYFTDHMKTKHSEMFGDVLLSFACPFCVTEFSSKLLVREHCLTCLGKSFGCHHCDKRFNHDHSLKNHLDRVNGIKSFKCSSCVKAFFSKAELRLHSSTHSNEKPYTCTYPVCGKVFRTNSHRSAHMDTHNVNKKFVCSTCGDLFQTRGSRRIHQQSHSNTLQSCAICSKEFKQRSHYVRHVKSVHNIQCTSLNLESVMSKQANKNVKLEEFMSNDETSE